MKSFLTARHGSTNGSGNDGDTKTINGIECVLVKAGTFMMGGDMYDREKPIHKVTITNDFYIGKYPITQAQFESATGENPSSFMGDNKPVESVTWNDAAAFCEKIGNGCRLPTEAEWEFAARGGNKSKGYIYSGSNNLDSVGWHSSKGTKDVGQKKPNELGIYDMSGNVWEWCSDWYGDYSHAEHTNPKGLDKGSRRVFRGGCSYYYPENCRVAYRYFGVESYEDYYLGFRVVFPAE